MKRIVYLAVSAAILAGLAVPAHASSRKRRANKVNGFLAEYAEMPEVLDLTDAQKSELDETLQACAADDKERQKLNAFLLGDLHKRLVRAREGGDNKAMASITEQINVVKAKIAQKRRVAVAVIMDILTDEQKAEWAGYTIYRLVIPRFRKAELTDEQDKKVRALCTAKAKDIPAEDAKARAEALAALVASIIESVLTDEQKYQVTGKKPLKNGGGKISPKVLRGDTAEMLKVLTFTDAQKAQFTKALEAHAEADRKWKEAYAARIAELKKQVTDAKASGNAEALGKAQAEYRALKIEAIKRRTGGGGGPAVADLLTDEQKAQWIGYKAYRRVILKFKKLKLTDEQDKKVREICTARGADILSSDRMARAKAYGDVTAAITDTVLTPEQKAELTERK